MSMSYYLDDNIDIRYGRSSIDVDLPGMKNDFRAKNGPEANCLAMRVKSNHDKY